MQTQLLTRTNVPVRGKRHVCASRIEISTGYFWSYSIRIAFSNLCKMTTIKMFNRIFWFFCLKIIFRGTYFSIQKIWQFGSFTSCKFIIYKNRCYWTLCKRMSSKDTWKVFGRVMASSYILVLLRKVRKI